MSTFSLAGLRNVADELRATYYPKNETEKKVYEALSGLKNWGASTTLLNDIAADTFDYEKYPVVMTTVWNLVSSEGRTWKQLFKALSLLEFLVKSGAERCIEDMRDHMRVIRGLQEYNFYEGNVDKGGGVREKAGQLVSLLSNNESIREEREKARRLRDKFVGISNNGYGGSGGRSHGGSNRDSYSNDNYSGSGGASSGGSGRYNSRYGDDSRDRFANEGSSGYGNGGIDSYASGGIASTRKSPARYGGGSYDTENKSRYSDDTADALDVRPSPGRSGRSGHAYNDPYASHSGDAHDDTSKKSSKIKISIKGSNQPSRTAPPIQPQAEVDLFADPTPAAPAAAPPAPLFDAFADGPVSAPPVAAPGHPDNFFDGFVSAAPVAPAAPPAAVAFDPFAPQPHHSVPVQNPSNNFSHGAAMPLQGQYPAQTPAPVPNFAPQPGYPGGVSYPLAQQQPVVSQAADAQDFGDFESAKPAAPAAKSKPVKNDWSSLVNLDNMQTVSKPNGGSSQEKKNDGQDSFKGLDGFSKPQQNANRMGGVSNAPLSAMGGGMHGGHMQYPGGQMGIGIPAPMGGPPGGYPVPGQMGGPMGGQMGGAPGGYHGNMMGQVQGMPPQQMSYNQQGGQPGYYGGNPGMPPNQPYRY